MRIYLEELASKVVADHIAGTSFKEIAKKYFLQDADHAQLIYEWELSAEPTEWKQQLLDIEYLRLDNLHRTYWKDAVAGDIMAGKIVLQIIAQKMKFIEQRNYFPPERGEAARKLLLEDKNDYLQIRKQLQEDVKKINEFIEIFDWTGF